MNPRDPRAVLLAAVLVGCTSEAAPAVRLLHAVEMSAFSMALDEDYRAWLECDPCERVTAPGPRGVAELLVNPEPVVSLGASELISGHVIPASVEQVEGGGFELVVRVSPAATARLSKVDLPVGEPVVVLSRTGTVGLSAFVELNGYLPCGWFPSAEDAAVFAGELGVDLEGPPQAPSLPRESF